MADSGDPFDVNNMPAAKTDLRGPLLVAAILIGFGIFAFWAMQDKKAQKERLAATQSLEQELTADEAAVKAERGKLEDLTKRVEQLRAKIQLGDVPDGKAAVAEFNALAADQRAEREKFLQMAEQFNQKVAKFHQLEQ